MTRFGNGNKGTGIIVDRNIYIVRSYRSYDIVRIAGSGLHWFYVDVIVL